MKWFAATTNEIALSARCQVFSLKADNLCGFGPERREAAIARPDVCFTEAGGELEMTAVVKWSSKSEVLKTIWL